MSAIRPAVITAEKNGTPWSPQGVEANIGNDSLTINATSLVMPSYTIAATKIDSMTLKIAYTGPGVYKLAGSQNLYGTFNSNGALNKYTLDPTFNNTLNITSYQTLANSATLNPSEHMITGTFSFKFTDPGNPAGISFSNGSFYIILPN